MPFAANSASAAARIRRRVASGLRGRWCRAVAVAALHRLHARRHSDVGARSRYPSGEVSNWIVTAPVQLPAPVARPITEPPADAADRRRTAPSTADSRRVRPALVDAAVPVPLRRDHRRRQHDPQRGAARRSSRDLGAIGLAAPVDRRRLHVVFACLLLDGRRARRPLRPAARAHVRRRRGSACSRSLASFAHVARPAHRRPRAHGPRRRVHLPGHAVGAHQRLPRPRRAGQGHRHLGRRVGHRHRHRPAARRHARRALRLGVGVLHQRAGLRAGARRRVDPRAPAACATRTARSTRSAACCRSCALSTLLFAIIEAPEHGWTSDGRARRLRRVGRRCIAAVHRRGRRTTAAPDARRALLREPSLLARRRPPSRSRSSRCSARRSC